jgi:hypothetical protein
LQVRKEGLEVRNRKETKDAACGNGMKPSYFCNDAGEIESYERNESSEDLSL